MHLPETTDQTQEESAPPRRARVAARVGPHATVIDVDDAISLRLDAEGRWSAWRDGSARFRRAVDGAVLVPQGAAFAPCDAATAAAVHETVAATARRLLDLLPSLAAEELSLIGSREDLRARLRSAGQWSAERHRVHAAGFAQTFLEQVPILPPHRYRDLVIQPARGCPNHRCTFCAFYRDVPFEVVDLPTFEGHLAAVHAWFGQAVTERDGIFLGSASALSMPDKLIFERLARVDAVFGRPHRGLAAFYDPDRGAVRTAASWANLVDAGVADVTIGLETALPELRASVQKSPDLGRVHDCVVAMKRGGVRVALTVLLGLGGASQAPAHRDATLAWLGELPLERSDLVYLSPLDGAGETEAGAAALATWRQDLRDRTEARVGSYRIERFAWLA